MLETIYLPAKIGILSLSRDLNMPNSPKKKIFDIQALMAIVKMTGSKNYNYKFIVMNIKINSFRIIIFSWTMEFIKGHHSPYLTLCF